MSPQVTRRRNQPSDRADVGAALYGLAAAAVRRIPREMSLTSASTLFTLEQTGPRRITDLSVIEGVTQPAMTVLIRVLEKTGMKTADFTGELTPDGQIAVPPEIVSQVPPGEKIQVVLRCNISMDDVAWRALGRQQFENAYDADDSVYELLIHDIPAR